MRANNPFVYNVPVATSNFIGRERELSLIFNQLRSPNRANIAIHGPLGIGKTSLLNYVSNPETARRYGLDPSRLLLCHIDCQSLGDFTPQRFWKRLLRNIARVTDGALHETVEGLYVQDEVSFEDIRDLLDELEYAHKVLLALLDEFECVVRTHTDLAERMTHHFLGMLSSLGRQTPRVFTMIIATEQPLSNLDKTLDVWRGSPFPTVFINQELRPFTEIEAADLIDQALAGTTVSFSPEEREFLYQQTGGYPALFQQAAAAMFEGKNRGFTGHALQDMVREAVTDGRANGSSSHLGQASLYLDRITGVVWVSGKRVEDLSNKEFNLLQFLYRNAGRVCHKDEIWHAVWPEYEQGMADYPIQKVISRLRRKIEPTPSRPQYILTVRGRGYKLMR